MIPNPLQVGAQLAAAPFAELKKELMLDHCKWDPQVGATSTLLDFPLLITDAHWRGLTALAEALALETAAVEAELLGRHDLHRHLGLPRALRKALRTHQGPATISARVMRFDFHWTPQGWRVSEVISDVPGGYCEASTFARKMALLMAGECTTAGSPDDILVSRIKRLAGDAPVALLSAAGYMEDHQVTSYLAQKLRAAGVRARLASAANLRWEQGSAFLAMGAGAELIGAVFRFFQVEWLTKLLLPKIWRPLFETGSTPIINPMSAILTESKRLPLVWDELRASTATWRRTLPPPTTHAMSHGSAMTNGC